MLCKCLVTCLDYKRPVLEKQLFFKNHVKNLSILIDNPPSLPYYENQRTAMPLKRKVFHMEVILGIDIGGSTTKIVGLRTDGSVLSMLRVRAEDQVTSLYGALGNYLTSNGLTLKDVRRVVLTGVGASYV